MNLSFGGGPHLCEAWARGDLLFLSDLEAGLGDEIYHVLLVKL